MSYWKVDDPVWVKQRQSKWNEIKQLIDRGYSFDHEDLPYVEHYFLTGQRKQHELAFGEPVPLLYCLVWHPSADVKVWEEEYQRFKREARCEDSMHSSLQKSYQAIKGITGDGRPFLMEHNGGLYNRMEGRELLIFDFFFHNKAFLNDPIAQLAKKDKEECYLSLASQNFYMPDHIYSYGENKCVFDGFIFQAIDDFSKLQLTSNAFNCYLHSAERQIRIGRPKRVEIFKRKHTEQINSTNRIMALVLTLHNKRETLSTPFAQYIEKWIMQMEAETTSEEWKELWNAAKANAKSSTNI